MKAVQRRDFHAREKCGITAREGCGQVWPAAWFRCGVWLGSLSASSQGFGGFRCSEWGDGRHEHAVAFVVFVVSLLPLATGRYVHGGVAKAFGGVFFVFLCSAALRVLQRVRAGSGSDGLT